MINPFQRRDLQKLEARRFAAIARFKRGESNSEIARNLGVRVQTVQKMDAILSLKRNGWAAPQKDGSPSEASS